MSFINFQSSTGTAKLDGPERPFIDNFCFELFWAALGVSSFRFEENRVIKLIKHKESFGSPYRLRATDPESLHTELVAGVMGNVGFEIDDEWVPLWDVSLNTAKVLGNDIVKLMAKLVGQCEAHFFVEGPNRAWLADLIEAGRNAKILRPEMGWEGVMGLLREAADGPVITSYSASDSFPNPRICRELGTWDPMPYDEEYAWEQLSEDDRWNLAMDALRKRSSEQGWGLEASPDTLANLYGHSLTVFDMQEYAYRAATVDA